MVSPSRMETTLPEKSALVRNGNIRALQNRMNEERVRLKYIRLPVADNDYTIVIG